MLYFISTYCLNLNWNSESTPEKEWKIRRRRKRRGGCKYWEVNICYIDVVLFLQVRMHLATMLKAWLLCTHTTLKSTNKFRTMTGDCCFFLSPPFTGPSVSSRLNRCLPFPFCLWWWGWVQAIWNSSCCLRDDPDHHIGAHNSAYDPNHCCARSWHLIFRRDGLA